MTENFKMLHCIQVDVCRGSCFVSKCKLYVYSGNVLLIRPRRNAKKKVPAAWNFSYKSLEET